ncbi:hypothetical protein H696_02392 [Fonticula alba]|uniref:Mitochondrial import inner membrane translocase subunit n=1 Tax=Fonticula alba TaxID=691883 RepID=A0A058ZAK5_FONAL|nr:hypothetical protein H696_02392 [Fonticula alba]KCV71445.1 hypothetical protein H696_02392 [Fonticula alba]|eukprot:XP_009494568.1 hypothetical protein H696_02392 [Fonticula alba]
MDGIKQEEALELQRLLQERQSLSIFEEATLHYTSLCFDKCIGRIGTKLDSSEQTCLSNCVERFFDVSESVLYHIAGSADGPNQGQEKGGSFF